MRMKLLGTITQEEKYSIYEAYVYKLTLKFIEKRLSEKDICMNQDKLLAKAKKDLQEQFNDWWMQTCRKYGWHEFAESGWTVDFDANQVYLNIT